MWRTLKDICALASAEQVTGPRATTRLAVGHCACATHNYAHGLCCAALCCVSLLHAPLGVRPCSLECLRPSLEASTPHSEHWPCNNLPRPVPLVARQPCVSAPPHTQHAEAANTTPTAPVLVAVGVRCHFDSRPLAIWFSPTVMRTTFICHAPRTKRQRLELRRVQLTTIDLPRRGRAEGDVPDRRWPNHPLPTGTITHGEPAR